MVSWALPSEETPVCHLQRVGPAHTGWSDQQTCGYSSALMEVLGWGWRGCTSQDSRRGSRPMGTASCHLVASPNSRPLPIPTPSQQMQDSLHTWLRVGQAQASPLSCRACLLKALSIGSGAGSHKPHPQQEMKPELCDAGSSVPGPTPGTAIPTHGTSALVVRPHSQTGRGYECHHDTSEGCSPTQGWCGHCRLSPLPVQLWMPVVQEHGTTPSNLPTPVPWGWRYCLAHGEGYSLGSRDLRRGSRPVGCS